MNTKSNINSCICKKNLLRYITGLYIYDKKNILKR